MTQYYCTWSTTVHEVQLYMKYYYVYMKYYCTRSTTVHEVLLYMKYYCIWSTTVYISTLEYKKYIRLHKSYLVMGWATATATASTEHSI
jgi:hypothetical protein